MKVVLKDSEYKTKDINLIDGDKTLSILFAGTGDLYWIIKNSNHTKEDYDCFEISKENYQVYLLFETLLNDIRTINIFDKTSYIEYIETDEEKKRYKMFNKSYYNDLYDEDTNTITWVSDETGFEVANMVTIKKIDDKFLVEFKKQPYIDGYERESNIQGIIGIRFRNSGSRYKPFNIVFMRMFDKLQQIDDVNDYGHQIHIEEYLYQKETIKKLIKK